MGVISQSNKNAGYESQVYTVLGLAEGEWRQPLGINMFELELIDGPCCLHTGFGCFALRSVLSSRVGLEFYRVMLCTIRVMWIVFHLFTYSSCMCYLHINHGIQT